MARTRYFSTFDMVVVLLGVAAVVGLVISAVVTRGDSLTSIVQKLFGS